MSLYASIDDKPAGDVATNGGWADFGRWVATLEGVTELRQLTEYGLADDAEQLAADLRGAVADGQPTLDQASIAAGLVVIADAAEPGEVITVSDGVGVEEGGEELVVVESITAWLDRAAGFVEL